MKDVNINLEQRELSCDEIAAISGGGDDIEEITVTAPRLSGSSGGGGSFGGFGSNRGPTGGTSGGFGGYGGGSGAPTRQERDQAQYERDRQAAQEIAERRRREAAAVEAARRNSGLSVRPGLVKGEPGIRIRYRTEF